MPTRCCVGIDLGTTFSSLAYVDDGNKVHPLRVEGDRYAIASAVHFHGPEELEAGNVAVGTEALNYSVIHPDRVARAFKRHMGDDAYRFECHGRAYRAEELSAMVLQKLLATAAQVVGPVEEAVISVPAHFDEAKRRATVAAGKIAGLTRVDLINEPEAAALAYGHTVMGGLFKDAEVEKLYGENVTLLVYDLGGGTFDVTIARYDRDGKFEVLATDGEVSLGGEDWDAVLLEYVARRYYEQQGEPDPARSARREFPFTEDLRRRDPSALQQMLLDCVEAKKTLSERPQAVVVFDRDGKEVKVTVTREQFMKLTAHLVNRTEAMTTGLLAREGKSWSHIERILLVGGSSRMPMIGSMMDRVTGRPLDRSLPPDTAIAEGAALYAALRSGGRRMKIEEFQSVNAHPLGLRVRDADREYRNDVLLPANRPTRTAVTKQYRVTPGKSWGRLVILQGESPNPEACVPLGQVVIHGLPADTAPGDMVDVTFSFQDNGLLHVAAVLRPKSGAAPTRVEHDLRVEGTLDDDQITDLKTGLPGIWMD
jgi:molecular chaperone DnaK